MSFFGFKQFMARGRFVAVIIAALLVPSAHLSASPITGTVGTTEAPTADTLEPIGSIFAPPSFRTTLAPEISEFGSPSRPDLYLMNDLLGHAAASPESPFGNSASSTGVSPGELRTSATQASGEKAGDEPLRQVLRSIATMQAFEGSAAIPSAFDPGPTGVTFTERGSSPRSQPGASILDSRTVGRVLREFVDIQAEGERSIVFSVLGMGDFVLEKTRGSGAVTLSELSSGWSASLSPSRDEFGSNGTASDAERMIAGTSGNRSALLLALDWLLDFLWSPLGIVLLMIAGVIAALTGIVRFTAMMRNQAAQRRRIRRRRRKRRSSARHTRPRPAAR